MYYYCWVRFWIPQENGEASSGLGFDVVDESFFA